MGQRITVEQRRARLGLRHGLAARSVGRPAGAVAADVLVLHATDPATVYLSALARLARVNQLDDWRFTEWFHGRTFKPMGMAGQSWNAATFLLARRAIEREFSCPASAGSSRTGLPDRTAC